MLKKILPGLLTAQIISSLQVYFSNVDLYRFLTAADSLGYLIIPGPYILSGLKTPGPALLGGLFFTLTLGAGLSILSYGLARIWVTIFRKTPYFLVAVLFLWSGLLLGLNMKGFSLFPSLYFTIIPVIVFHSTLSSFPGKGHKINQLSIIIHLSPVLIMALLWVREYDRSMLVDIRDNLLLTTAAGQKINDFYYRYTLYAAEAFKSLEQKQLKGCVLKSVDDSEIRGLVEEALLGHDYLILDTPGTVHLELHLKEEDLLFIKAGKEIQQVMVNDFLTNPGAALRTYSQKADTQGLFRHLIYFSLLGGFPVLLYLIVYSVLARALRFLARPEWSGQAASVLCLVLGLMILFYFQNNRSPELTAGDIGSALQSSDWRERTAALKFIEEKKLEIGQYIDPGALLASATVPDKYWLARALGQSKRRSTMKDLIALLNDPQPNVVCMALESLGKRGDKRSIPLVREKIQRSNHWYIQWYAYRTLRALGWKQERLA